MAYRLFEGKDHASIYQKYRFTPPAGLKDIIIQYLDKKVCLKYNVQIIFTYEGLSWGKTLTSSKLLSATPEGTATWAGGGSGMWNGTEFTSAGTALQGSSGSWHQWVSSGGG